MVTYTDEEILDALRYVATDPTVFSYGRHCTLDMGDVLRERGLAEWRGGNGIRLTELGRLALSSHADTTATQERE